MSKEVRLNKLIKDFSMKIALLKFDKFKFFASVVMTLLLACGKSGHTTNSTGIKDKVDSLSRNIRDTDSLMFLLDNFQKENSLEGQMIVLKHLGRRQRELNKFADAIESHTKEAEIARKLCDTIEMVHAYNNIGTNYRRMSMLEDATAFHYKALHLCELLSDTSSHVAKKNRVVSLNGIGNISLRMGDNETADSMFRAALKGESELGSALGQAINYANLGSIFESKGMTDSAWVYYRKSLEMNIKANSDLGRALCYGHFGNLYEKEEKYELAINEFEKAYQMEGRIDDWHWLNSCLDLAQIHIKQGYLWPATDLLAKAEVVALESRSRDHLADIYDLQYKIHEANGRWAKALEAYKKSQLYKDSIVSEKNLIQIQNERVRFEYERRQQEIDSINESFAEEKKLRTTISIAVAIIALLSLFAIVTLLYLLRLKKKQQKALLQLEDVRSTFFTNITHEFRTPLTIIIGYGERLKNGLTTSEELAEMGQTITRHGNNLLTLINQILDLSKLKSKQNTLEYHNGNIVGYIHTIVESMRELARRKGILLLFSPEKQSIMMDFIPDHITKIVTNLISNAIKFTPEEGHIFVTADIEGDMFKMIVADNGHGIDINELPHIFDAFYQGRNSKLETGSGVGLSLVKQLVETMSGNIEIRSAEEAGCVITLSFPLKQGEREWPALADSAIPHPQFISNETDNGDLEDDVTDDDDKPVVLIVEDNNDIMTYIASIIGNEAHILYAQTGQIGLDKALTHIPDIIITDLMMPEMDGLEMCRQIRNNELSSHIPIIVITAKCSEEDKIEGIRAGANYYLYKPFNAKELCVTIESALTHRHAIQENIIRNHGEVSSHAKDISSKDRVFLNKVIDTIHVQMKNQGTTNEDIASALCISTKQLNRKITVLTGESLAKYVLRVKMSHARKLLEADKNYSIQEIAQKCGYEDHSNFTRAFKSVYGVTPTQYKKDNRYKEVE